MSQASWSPNRPLGARIWIIQQVTTPPPVFQTLQSGPWVWNPDTGCIAGRACRPGTSDDRGLGGGQTGDGCGEDRGCHRGQELLVAMAHVAVPQLIVVGLQQRVPVLGCEDSARAALGARGAHKEVAGLRAWGGG